jgi:hypothetical protein
MQRHEWLREAERNRRVTVSDAIEVLAQSGAFGGGDVAEIQVGGICLPSGKVVGLTNVSFNNDALDKTLVVSLATSAQFNAKRQGESAARTFSIFELDGATVANDGSVRLSDGTILRAVEVIPANLPLKPSELDWRIVRHVIRIIGAEGRCYRSLREHAKPRCLDLPHDIIPDIRFIDCSALKGLELPSVKSLVAQIAKIDPALKNLSRQTIANALCKFGMRIPASRPRKRAVAVSP